MRLPDLRLPHPRDAGAAIGAVLTGMDLGWLGDQLRAFAGPNQSVLSVHDRDLVFLARVPDEAGLIGQKPPSRFRPFLHSQTKEPSRRLAQMGARELEPSSR